MQYGLTLRNQDVLALSLMLLVSAFLGPATLSAGESTSSTLGTNGVTNAQSYEVLRERARTEPLKDLNDEWFKILLSGRRENGVLQTDVALHDPPNPNTLSKNFAEWNLTARASLLLSYAKLVTTSPAPDPAGLSVKQPGAILPKDAARIAQIVEVGRYANAWQPFVVAYLKWVASTEATLPDRDSPDNAATDQLVARLAREQGMFQLVREIQIDPSDVANEMLRLLDDWRMKNGVPNEVTAHGPNLFYVCDAEATSVHVHPWHRLAPAFFQAWESVDKKHTDLQPVLVMREFEGLSKDIKAWVAKHPKADGGARDRVLNEMAVARGLYSMLEG